MNYTNRENCQPEYIILVNASDWKNWSMIYDFPLELRYAQCRYVQNQHGFIILDFPFFSFARHCVTIVIFSRAITFLHSVAISTRPTPRTSRRTLLSSNIRPSPNTLTSCAHKLSDIIINLEHWKSKNKITKDWKIV